MLTALGHFVGISPIYTPDRTGAPIGWTCTAFNLRGHWIAQSVHTTEDDARSERRKIFAHHRKMAAKLQRKKK